MKNLKIAHYMSAASIVIAVAFALAGSTMLTGCKATIVNHDFKIDINKDFVVLGVKNDFHAIDSVDLSTNADFNKYKNDISNVTIDSAWYSINYTHGSSTQKITTASVGIGPLNTMTMDTLGRVSNVILSTVVGEQPVTLDAAGTQKLHDLLKNAPNAAKLYLDGNVNEVPLDFGVHLHMKLTATYSKQLL